MTAGDQGGAADPCPAGRCAEPEWSGWSGDPAGGWRAHGTRCSQPGVGRRGGAGSEPASAAAFLPGPAREAPRAGARAALGADAPWQPVDLGGRRSILRRLLHLTPGQEATLLSTSCKGTAPKSGPGQGPSPCHPISLLPLRSYPATAPLLGTYRSVSGTWMHFAFDEDKQRG